MATVSSQKSLNLFGRTFDADEIANVKNLVGIHKIAGASYSSLRLTGGSAAYQATGGPLKVWAWMWTTIQGGTASMDLNIGYADNDVGVNTATVPTSPIYYTTDGFSSIISETTVSTKSEHQNIVMTGGQGMLLYFECPVNKYLFTRSGSGNDFISHVWAVQE